METIDEEAYNAWLAQQDDNKIFDAAVSLQYQLDDAYKQLETAKEIIESLVKVEWTMDNVGFSEECPWCESPKVNIYADSPHEPNCPRQVAVAFLEGK